MRRSGVLPAERPRKRLVRIESPTDDKYGKRPSERSIPELLACGLVPLDKPAGPTSHQVAAWLRLALDVKEVGHGGTLDPNVTGALPVAIGSGVKTLQGLLAAGKEYVCVLRLHGDAHEADVKRVAAGFVGKVNQTPPTRSAVAKRPRLRRIYYLDVMETEGRDVLFRVGCQAGTYIRNLCVDMGRALGVKGHMQELRRTRTGLYTEADLVSLHDVRDAMAFYRDDHDEAPLRRAVRPIESATAHLNHIVVRDAAIEALCHGAPLAAVGVAQIDAGIEEQELVAILSLKGELVALGRAEATSQAIVAADTGIVAKVERVVMRRGTYPRVWGKAEA